MAQRILIINSLYSPYIGGGAEIICQEQAEGLAARGHHVAVLTTTDKEGITEDVVNGLKVYRAHIENVYWHYGKMKPGRATRMVWHLRDIYNQRMKRHVREVIRKETPDVVICHNITGFSISVWDVIREFHLPIVQVLHDQYLQCPNSNAFKGGKACESQCLPCHMMRLRHVKASQKVDVVVGVSQYVLSRLTTLGYFQGVKQIVIHNARKFEEISMGEPWDGNRPLHIGYIGTLSRVKGVEWLIQSFMQLDINATLTIAGKGESEEYEQYLRELAASDNRITFSGYVKSVEHYRSIDISVIPSLWPDTFPTVAFESCAYNVPVIVTNMGGLPEIVKDGHNGLVISATDKNAIKDALMRIYLSGSLLDKLSRQARVAVKEMTEPELVIDKYENIISQI